MPQGRPLRGRHNAEVGIIVWPGAYAMSTPFEAGLADQLGERVMDRRDSEPHAEPGEEERGRAGLRPAAVTRLGVSAQRLDHAVVQRHLALLSLLAADTQRPVVEIDVFAIEGERLADCFVTTWCTSSPNCSGSMNSTSLRSDYGRASMRTRYSTGIRGSRITSCPPAFALFGNRLRYCLGLCLWPNMPRCNAYAIG
jgi:hypothetical protein